MANMSAFQANDESSILSARTKEKSRVIDTAFFFGPEMGGLNSHRNSF